MINKSDKEPDLPNTLYHYCGIAGFHGILTSKQIWMSHAHFMNDYSEQTWFLDKARKHLDELSKGADRDLVRPLIEHFTEMGSSPYICCFSEAGDLLSQWRAYSDNGTGFAIGFSSRWLKEEGGKNLMQGGSQLWPVIYDDDDQGNSLNHYINKYLDRVKMDGKPTDPGRDALLAIWTLAAFCKNKGFREEKEFRLVGAIPYHPANDDVDSLRARRVLDMQFRATAVGIIPYCQWGNRSRPGEQRGGLTAG